MSNLSVCVLEMVPVEDQIQALLDKNVSDCVHLLVGGLFIIYIIIIILFPPPAGYHRSDCAERATVVTQRAGTAGVGKCL